VTLTVRDTAVNKEIDARASCGTQSISRRGVLTGLTGLAVSYASIGRSFAAWRSSAPGQSNPQPVPNGPTIQAAVTVSENPIGSVGPAFVGLCYEKTKIVLQDLFRPSNKNLLGLLHLIGPGILRIGGDSPDKSVWTPNGRGNVYTQVTPNAVDRLASFLQVSGWRCLYCINLAYSANGETSPQQAADEVAYVARKLGPMLYGIEIGNEPDVYDKPPRNLWPKGGAYYGKPWDLSIYETVWNRYRDAIVAKTPGVMITGPAAGHEATWTIPFSEHETKARLSLLTDHYYYGHASVKTDHFTIEKFLSPDRTIVRNLKMLKDASQVTGIPFRVAECNSYTGELPGVVDAYASALWSLGFLFDCAQGGATGTNFTSGGNAKGGYTPIADDKDNVTEVRPEFYGLLFFTLAGQGSVYETKINAGNLNAVAYTIKTATGMSIVIVNKDLAQNLKVSIDLPQSVLSANLVAMTQQIKAGKPPDPAATSGVTIQNSTVEIDGKFNPAAPHSLTASGTAVNCYVPALSAVLIRTT